MFLDSLSDWRAPLAALAAALSWAALMRRRPDIAGLGLPIGVLLGFALLLGIGLASPRQVFERLPGLALGALVLAIPIAVSSARWLRFACTAAAAMLAGWWMAGSPLNGEDMRRAASVWLAVGFAAALLALETEGRWRALAMAALLATLLALAGAPGPWMQLGLVVVAACLGASAAGATPAPAARLPLATVGAALMAGPVVTRGGAADWLAALGPLALLLLAPRLAGGGRARAAAAWIGMGALPIAIALALRNRW